LAVGVGMCWIPACAGMTVWRGNGWGSLLDRQLAAQARAFKNEGGFSERLGRVRRGERR